MEVSYDVDVPEYHGKGRYRSGITIKAEEFFISEHKNMKLQFDSKKECDNAYNTIYATFKRRSDSTNTFGMCRKKIDGKYNLFLIKEEER